MEGSENLPKIQPTEAKSDFNIIGERHTDSFGTTNWKEYLQADRLAKAWLPPEGSPYMQFFKDKTIRSVNKFTTSIKPRYSEGDETSEKGIKELIDDGNTGIDTGIILDSGGAHSVAMAVKLAERGYQPVIMFDSIPDPNGMNSSEQKLATLIYFAKQVSQLKEDGVFKADSPPVFVLDAHRNDNYIRESARVDNTYTYSVDDFPSAQQLKQHGITKLIYLNEGNKNGKINASSQSPDRLEKDLKPIALEWEKADIKILYTGVDPWEWEKEEAISPFFGKGLSSFSKLQEPERKLSYQNMPSAIYGDNSEIAMHRNRQRFSLMDAINESGIVRDLTPEEKTQFKSEIEKQASNHPENQALKELFNNFPQQEPKKTKS